MFEFQWQVHTKGYQWIETSWDSLLPPEERAGTVWCLVPTLGEDAQPPPLQNYRPLHTKTALFRTFAQKAPTRDDICEFANQYGLLGGEIDTGVLLSWPQKPHRRIPLRGICFDRWVYEQLLMRHVISLWDMLRKNNLDGLSHHVRWYGQDRVYYQSIPGVPAAEPVGRFPESQLIWDTHGTAQLEIKAWIAAPWYDAHMLDGLKAGELVKPTWCFMQRVINERLKRSVAPQIVWDVTDKALILRFMPRSLRGALWLQLAQAIDGKKEYRQCKESRCQAWFELAPQVARTDKQFCSNACKTHAYRERQHHARQLYAEGQTVQSIAQQVGSDIGTVQKWLRQGS